MKKFIIACALIATVVILFIAAGAAKIIDSIVHDEQTCYVATEGSDWTLKEIPCP